MHISFGFDEEDAAYIVWDVFSSIIFGSILTPNTQKPVITW